MAGHKILRKVHVALPLSSSTTMIGSLPHHNIDTALDFSFRVSIPFLPQIPIRNPWEFMIAQALEGMPGLEIARDGSTVLNREVWLGRTQNFNQRLIQAFERDSEPEAFEAFEPSSAASSSWQPFLWELTERKVKLAKIQIAGPITCQWVLRTKDGSHTEKTPEISAQIYRLVLARALAMSRRLFLDGIQPILFLDEPGLFALNPSNPKHLVSLQELKITIQALKKEGVIVGLHCCSHTDWPSVFSLGLDVLSIDTAQSLKAVTDERSLLDSFLLGGGRLCLGVIPTTREASLNWNAKALYEATIKLLEPRIVRESILTPACGLALHDAKDAETILETLLQFQRLV